MTNSFRHIVFLINPISGGRSKKRMIDMIETLTTKASISFEILPTDKDGKYPDLKGRVEKKEITDVVVCGGDGTVSQVAGCLQGLEVAIGIIPAGSGNGLARASGIPLKIEDALQVIYNNHAVLVDGFKINNNFSCMLSGLGFDARVAHNFSKRKSRGLISYVIETVKHFFSASSYHFNIVVNNREHNVRAFFISIANSNQFGNEVTIAPQAQLNDGKLDVVVVNHMNKAKIIWAVIKQIRSGKVRPIEGKEKVKGVYYFQTSHLTIANFNLAPLHIDGDPVETSEEIKIDVIPNAFRLHVPFSSSLQ